MNSSAVSAPPPPGATAPVDSRGTLLSHHPCRFITVLAIGVLLTLAGLAMVISNLRQPDDLYLVGGTTALVIGIPCLLWAAYLRSNHAWCYEKALVIQRGPWRTEVPWENIDNIKQAVVNHSVNFIPTGTSFTYHVKVRDGKTFRFDNHYANVAKLGQAVNENIIRTQLPGIMQEFRAGKPVQFGSITFDRNGISHGKTLVPWAEFKTISYDSGYLRVHKQKDGVKGALTGGSIVVHITGLPNFYLLDAFVRALSNRS